MATSTISSPIYRPLSALRRALLIALGTATLGLGIAGIFLPGVPTTVFLLITLACYTRSSARLYTWVMTRTWLQRPLQVAFAYKEKRALSVRIKLIAQGVAWSSVVLTVFTGARPALQLLTVVFAASCSIAMAVIKTEGGDAPRRMWRMTAGDIARQLAYGTAAGALAGLIWGVAGSAITRLGANIAALPPQLNPTTALPMLAGTAVLGALTGLAYAGLQRWLPRSKWANGALFGVILMVTLGAALYASPFFQADIARLGSAWPGLIVALFVANFIAYGIILCLAFRTLEARSSHAAARPARA